MASWKLSDEELANYEQNVRKSIIELMGNESLFADLSVDNENSYAKESADVITFIGCVGDMTKAANELLKLQRNRIISHQKEWHITDHSSEFGYFFWHEIYCPYFYDEFLIDVRIKIGASNVIDYIDYYEYIKSDTWRKLRNEILVKDGLKCRMCKSHKNLQVHHLTYERLFYENQNDLITLCKYCHEKTHGK